MLGLGLFGALGVSLANLWVADLVGNLLNSSTLVALAGLTAGWIAISDKRSRQRPSGGFMTSAWPPCSAAWPRVARAARLYNEGLAAGRADVAVVDERRW